MLSAERAAKIRNVINNLQDEDLEYARSVSEKSYEVEIDRRDKILSSMAVLSAPITLVFAGIGFLINFFLQNADSGSFRDSDIMLILFYISAAFLLAKIVSLIYNFHRLLSGENYYYLPNAQEILSSLADNHEYCLSNGLVDDGIVSNYVTCDQVMQLAECATRNATANDRRLRYRQKIFSDTTAAIICVALGFSAVAIHRKKSDIWRPLRVLGNVHGRHSGATSFPPQGVGTAAPVPSSTSVQARSGQQRAPSPAAAGSTAAGGQ